jgi:CSLREA domain-containing protein
MLLRTLRWFLLLTLIGCPFFATKAASIRLPAMSIAVNVFTDTPDTAPGDGICADTNGGCSLRAAIMEANALEPGSSITLPSGSFYIDLVGAPEDAATSGDLDITNSMTISGIRNVQAPTIIDFYENYPGDGGFHLKAAQPISVRITDLIIIWGFRDPATADDFTYGGNMWADGANITATLERVWLGYGYAVRGGGLAATGGASVKVDSSTLYYNNGGISSGGIEVDSSTVEVVNSTIALNSASNGGGIAVRNSGTVTVNNATIASNGTPYAGVGRGGGIQNVSGTVNISNTIVGLNLSTVGPDCTGSLNSTGDNLFSSDDDCDVHPDDLVDVNPMLDTFAVNAPGSTPTYALVESSPALDAGTNATCAPKDQRGIDRPVGTACDIGAYEGSVRNIVVNGGFETADPANNKLPANWNLKNGTNDRRVCNKPDKQVAFEGECVFYLKGKPGEKSVISQKIDGISIATGTGISTKFYLQGENFTPSANFGAVIKYTDPSIPSTKFVFEIPSSGYGYLQYSGIVAGSVKTIKMRGMYSGASGRLLIDAVTFNIPSENTLMLTDVIRNLHPLRAKSAWTISAFAPSGYRVAEPLPLPPAQ